MRELVRILKKRWRLVFVIVAAVAILVIGRVRTVSPINNDLCGKWTIAESSTIPTGGELHLYADSTAVWIDENGTRRAAWWKSSADEVVLLFVGDGERGRIYMIWAMLVGDPYSQYGLHYGVRAGDAEDIVLVGPRETKPGRNGGEVILSAKRPAK